MSIIALHVCGAGLLGLRPEAVRTRECCPEGGLIIRDRDKARGSRFNKQKRETEDGWVPEC